MILVFLVSSCSLCWSW